MWRPARPAPLDSHSLADKPGETEAKLTVTYENSDGQPQTKEFPVKINAVEAPVPDDSDTDVDVQDQSMPVWVWIVAGGRCTRRGCIDGRIGGPSPP